MRNGSNPQFLRMFGGVAGYMDQASSDTLTELPNGSYGYVPSKKYFNQLRDLQENLVQEPVRQTMFERPIFRQSIRPEQQEEDIMDVSKYIGISRPIQQKEQTNSQVELLKMALKPISDQLEKVCVLLGMIYQELNKNQNNEVYNELELEDDEELDPQKEIEVLEKRMDKMAKAPTTEEIGEAYEGEVGDIEM